MNILNIVVALAGGPVARVSCALRRQHDNLTLHDGSKICRRCLTPTPSRLVT